MNTRRYGIGPSSLSYDPQHQGLIRSLCRVAHDLDPTFKFVSRPTRDDDEEEVLVRVSVSLTLTPNSKP